MADRTIVLFVQFDFASGTQRYATYPVTIRWQGFDWLGVGRMLGFDPKRSAESLEATSWTASLSGLPVELVSQALRESVAWRTWSMWIVDLTPSGEDFLVQEGGDPLLFENGDRITLLDAGWTVLHSDAGVMSHAELQDEGGVLV